MKINKYPHQSEGFDKNIELVTPIMLYRLTWRDAEFKYYELWSWDGNEIQDKKIQIDDSDSLEYINWENWECNPLTNNKIRIACTLWKGDKSHINLSEIEGLLLKSKKIFLEKYNPSLSYENALSDAINSSVGHNKLYMCADGERDEIRMTWSERLKQYAEKYKYEQSIKVYESDILNLQRWMNNKFSDKIYFKLSHSQKSLSIYLKHLYCLNLIPAPPCCPIDRIILSKIKSNEPSWTNVDNIQTHRTKFNEIKIEATKVGLKIADWELINFA